MIQEVSYKDVLKENLYFFSLMQIPNLPLRYNIHFCSGITQTSGSIISRPILLEAF
jgi:hypothetical protein